MKSLNNKNINKVQLLVDRSARLVSYSQHTFLKMCGRAHDLGHRRKQNWLLQVYIEGYRYSQMGFPGYAKFQSNWRIAIFKNFCIETVFYCLIQILKTVNLLFLKGSCIWISDPLSVLSDFAFCLDSAEMCPFSWFFQRTIFGIIY